MLAGSCEQEGITCCLQRGHAPPQQVSARFGLWESRDGKLASAVLRLLYLGHRRIIEFIRFLIEDYSKRDITHQTDRYVAMSGLQAGIARAIGCEGRYGTLQKYFHRNLLWQASDVKLEKIEYETLHVPSWSWMAYTGGIRFLNEEIPFGRVQ